MPGNELGKAASPYLLQHADNPVHWRMWGEAALADARSANKPILLSVGYAACHWCHVMAHESFEDGETAAVMNELFVNIKVDREERPDIDHIYMSALHAFGERGGWPLTMFLTPLGEPFWGGTYFPKTAQYGRPSFVTVLRSVAAAFDRDPDRIAQNTKAVLGHLAETPKGAYAQGLSLADLDALAPQVASYMDREHGGLRGAPKFPNPSILEFLWRAGARLGTDPYRSLVALSLDRMSEGGIYDHLGGGYARYSTDERWLVPHFEKMLYDNAQLLELLALAWAATGDGLFKTRAAETVGWLAREMTAAGGAFCASLDADSEGEEGKFYVWTWDEIVAHLGAEEAAFFGRFYEAGPAGNWTDEHHGKTVIVLNRLRSERPTTDEEARLAPLRQKLFDVRAGRIRPGLDDKIMADWNGLMIAALVRAGTMLGEADWVSRAARGYAFIVETLRFEDASGRPRLAHSWRDGVLVTPGLALDHAAMLRAALALHEARRWPAVAADLRHDYLGDAKRWAQDMLDFHRVPESGLLAMAASDAADVILRLAPTQDDAIPNAHAVFLDGLLRLAPLSGEDRWLAMADALFAAVAAPARASLVGHAGLLNALDSRLRMKEVVTAGPQRAPLYAAALAAPFLDRTIVDLDDPAYLPADHPARAQAAAAGEAAAFVCQGATCSLPVRNVEALVAAIEA